MSGIARLVAAAVLALPLLAAPQPTMAADLVVGVRVYDPGVCGDNRVLNTIVDRFGHQVRHVPNLPQVGIMQFYNIRENRFLPETERWPIERRYCQANVALTDGVSRDIWYLIEEKTGFAGLGANVEFCVAGFDRWYVYGGRCRVLR